jgi:hypothetical protein
MLEALLLTQYVDSHSPIEHLKITPDSQTYKAQSSDNFISA